MMLGVDTNIDKKQADIALSILEKNAVYVSKTVLLECECVLRGCYDSETNTIADAFEGLLGVDGITIEDERSISEALFLYRKGMDFGDALHLKSGRPVKRFITFDKKLVKKAKQLGVEDVILAE